MHNVNPINSNMVLITENIMGHNSCALTNGIINCVTQQPVERAGKGWGVSQLNPHTTISTAASDSAHCVRTLTDTRPAVAELSFQTRCRFVRWLTGAKQHTTADRAVTAKKNGRRHGNDTKWKTQTRVETRCKNGSWRKQKKSAAINKNTNLII